MKVNTKRISNKVLLCCVICMCFYIDAWAGNMSRKNVEEARLDAPEFIISEEDLTSYADFSDRIKYLQGSINQYEKGVKYDESKEENYIGIPNSFLGIEGYGLVTEKEISRLRLENAKLKKEDAKTIAILEKRFVAAKQHLEDFLSSNLWHD